MTERTGEPPGGGRSCALSRGDWAFVLVLLGVTGAARLLFYGDDGGGDVARYLGLSSALLEGYYGLDGVPSTGFAPGYPLLQAALRICLPSLADVIALQFALSLAVPVMIWWAGREFSKLGARIAATLLALNPMAASLAGTLISETLSTVLSALLALTVRGLFVTGPSLARGLMLGVVAAGAAMTAPHMVVLVVLLGAWLLVSRPSARLALGFALGCAVWFIPWQAWVVGVRGQPHLSLFNLRGPEYAFARSGYARWVRSWWETPEDIYRTWFYAPEPGRFPERGLPQGLTQADVLSLTVQPRQAPWRLSAETVNRYGELGSRLEGQYTRPEKLRRFLRRMLSLWTYYDAGPVWNLLAGVASDWPRPVQRVLWWGTLGLHWLLVLGLAVGLHGLLCGRPPLPYLALVPLAYTVLSSLNMHEPRRNLTVVPLLLFGLAVAMSKHRRWVM